MIKNADQLRIITFLKRFGCNRVESLTYIAAVTLGTVSIQDLSNHLKRNRVSVHYSVQQLIEKGFLFEIRKGKKRFIVAEHPDIMLKIIQQRHTELKSLETDVKYISELIHTIPVVKHEVTVVKLYEETEGFKKMLEETLQAEKEILIFSNTPIFLTMIEEEYYEAYFARQAAAGISSRMIYSPCAFADQINAKKEKYKIDLRILTQEQGSEAGFYLWNDMLAIQSLKENKKSCTLIQNKDITHFFRENIFNYFWKEAKPI